ncbi:MAG TPA: hypothetical protein VLF59_02565 [Candidatus Saccharimonadales bacterium]|nr:hypothetical protein [Candidatus Saccharimonadales bacterium]
MKRNQKNFHQPQDTPATRKQRLQQRMQELSDKSDREIASLMRTVDRIKTSFRPKKKKT